MELCGNNASGRLTSRVCGSVAESLLLLDYADQNVVNHQASQSWLGGIATKFKSSMNRLQQFMSGKIIPIPPNSI